MKDSCHPPTQVTWENTVENGRYRIEGRKNTATCLSRFSMQRMFLEGVGSDGVGDIKAVPRGVVLVPAVATLLLCILAHVSDLSLTAAAQIGASDATVIRAVHPRAQALGEQSRLHTRVLFCHIDLLYHTSVATAEKESGERFKKKICYVCLFFNLQLAVLCPPEVTDGHVFSKAVPPTSVIKTPVCHLSPLQQSNPTMFLTALEGGVDTRVGWVWFLAIIYLNCVRSCLPAQ